MKKLILGVAIFLTAIIYFINKKQKHYDNNIIKRNGAYYCNNHIIVNKDYEISPFYTPFPKLEALNALKVMISDADKQGFQLIIISGFRSYLKQMRLFKMYVQRDGLKKAQLYSAKPGFSEHQTGLAFDVATPGLHESAKALFQYTEESKWLEDNAHNYGFIIRYPEGKAHITQFMYEPWHLRYLGKKDAKEIKNTGLTLEEYFDLV